MQISLIVCTDRVEQLIIVVISTDHSCNGTQSGSVFKQGKTTNHSCNANQSGSVNRQGKTADDHSCNFSERVGCGCVNPTSALAISLSLVLAVY